MRLIVSGPPSDRKSWEIIGFIDTNNPSEDSYSEVKPGGALLRYNVGIPITEPFAIDFFGRKKNAKESFKLDADFPRSYLDFDMEDVRVRSSDKQGKTTYSYTGAPNAALQEKLAQTDDLHEVVFIAQCDKDSSEWDRDPFNLELKFCRGNEFDISETKSRYQYKRPEWLSPTKPFVLNVHFTLSRWGINSEDAFFNKIQELLPSSGEIDDQRRTFQQLLYRVVQQANWDATKNFASGTILENYKWRFKQSGSTSFSGRSLYEANNHAELLQVLRMCVKRHDPENAARQQLLSNSREIGYTNELERARAPKQTRHLQSCRFFSTPSGCRHGEGCDFLHVISDDPLRIAPYQHRR
ncbi:MAG: hypothetical protein ABIH77_05350 [Pseudomonadota bacterium]